MQAEANATTQTTAERLTALARLYQQGQASPLMDRTVDKLLAHEAEEARSRLTALDATCRPAACNDCAVRKWYSL